MIVMTFSKKYFYSSLILIALALNPLLLYFEYHFDTYGKQVEATVVEVWYGKYKGNNGIYQKVKAEYRVKGKLYENWFFSGSQDFKQNDKIQVKYSPLFPSVSKRYYAGMDRWQDAILRTIVLTIFTILVIGVLLLNKAQAEKRE